MFIFIFSKVPWTSYDSKNHDCVLSSNSNLNKPCTKDSDCLDKDPESSSLACDTSPLGNQTYTCKFILGKPCLSFESCVDNIDCQKFLCSCVIFYFNISYIL